MSSQLGELSAKVEIALEKRLTVVGDGHSGSFSSGLASSGFW
jgi:hypothetical protein